MKFHIEPSLVISLFLRAFPQPACIVIVLVIVLAISSSILKILQDTSRFLKILQVQSQYKLVAGKPLVHFL